jgi:lipopolysaccharide export system permease protein
VKDGVHTFSKGDHMDTTFNVVPSDFSNRVSRMDVMNFFELQSFINKERLKGSENIKFYLVEKYKRISFPFATLILSVIGVSLSSRKVRGGIGLHLALGITLSFAYIVFMQISTVFATYGTLSPLISVWLPNILFTFVALYLLKRAPK